MRTEGDVVNGESDDAVRIPPLSAVAFEERALEEDDEIDDDLSTPPLTPSAFDFTFDALPCMPSIADWSLPC